MLRYLCCNWNKRAPEPEPVDQDFEIKKIIMNGVLEGQSIDQVERLIIEQFGAEAMSYQDLDYYYYRYYNGKKGESYERSLVPKRPELLDLSDNLISKIVEKLDVNERWVFGNSSKKCYQLAGANMFREKRMILSGVIKGMAIEETDIHLEDSMTYQEFDFWYYYFYNGGRDLDYDRSLDPPPRQLTDLPNEMLDQILSNLPIVNRLQTCHVSRRFRALSDLRCSKLKIVRSVYFLRTYYDGVKMDRFRIKNFSKMEKAYDDLDLVLREARLKLKKLTIGFQSKVFSFDYWPEIIKVEMENVESLLSSLSHQVHVEKLELENCHLKDLLVVLPYLKPKVLKSIICDNLIWAEETYPETFLELSRLAQWSKTTYLEIRLRTATLSNIDLVRYFLHFKNITIAWGITDITDFLWIKELLLRSTALKLLKVDTDFYFSDFCYFLDPSISIEINSEDGGSAMWNVFRAGAIYHIESSRNEDDELTEISFTLKERRVTRCSAKRKK